MTTYYALIHKDPLSCYGVHFPDVLGCFSAGDTIKEAARNACTALELHFMKLDAIPPARDLIDLSKDAEINRQLETGARLVPVTFDIGQGLAK